MPDYKEMYLTLMAATETAMNIMISAQQKAEEIYMSEPDPEIMLLVRSEKTEDRRT